MLWDFKFIFWLNAISCHMCVTVRKDYKLNTLNLCYAGKRMFCEKSHCVLYCTTLWFIGNVSEDVWWGKIESMRVHAFHFSGFAFGSKEVLFLLEEFSGTFTIVWMKWWKLEFASLIWIFHRFYWGMKASKAEIKIFKSHFSLHTAKTKGWITS